MWQAIQQWGTLAAIAAMMLTIVLKLMYPRRGRHASDGGEGGGWAGWWASDETGSAPHHHIGFDGSDGGHNGS